jgi:hypothetical protein
MTKPQTVGLVVAEAFVVALCTVVSLVAIGADAYKQNREDVRGRWLTMWGPKFR